MPTSRRVKNLMGLAVLGTVYQRPMHRYEIASLMKAHGKDRDMDIKWGSLYTVVESLEKNAFLEVVGTDRQGGRPERTVYRITEAGVREMVEWTGELLVQPGREHPRFSAGLSMIAALQPSVVAELLEKRLARLDESAREQRAVLDQAGVDVPRLFLVEDEYALAMTEAEAAWVGAFRSELVDGTFPGLDVWTSFNESGVLPPELAELAERGADSPPPPATGTRPKPRDSARPGRKS